MKNLVLDRGSAYFELVRMGAKITFVYRANVIFQLAGVIVQVYLLKAIWTAIYVHSSTGHQVQLPVLISYLTLANLQTWVLTPKITDVLEERIRTGDVALDIAKPISFPARLMAQQFGIALSMVPFAVLGLPLAWLAGGLQAPASGVALLLYIVSCLLACCVVSLMGLLMGLISFWTFQLAGIQLIYRFVTQLFAGALIPLWLFPPALHTVAILLPFQAIAFLPVSIYLGQMQGTELAGAFATQLIWVLLLSALVQLIWFRAQRFVIVQGG